MLLSDEFASFLMSEAIAQAILAKDLGEVPIGAVVAHGGEIIARAHNQIETLRDATAHAECIAIREASKIIENWRLTDAVICSTLEPCTMCVGAIKLARIPVVIFGARDARAGALGSVYDLSLDGSPSRVIAGVSGIQCREVLSSFFKARRDAEMERRRDGRVVEGA